MSWARLDDRYPRHRKLMAAGPLRPLCIALDVSGICHAAEYATDGFIADRDLPHVLEVLPRNRQQAVLAKLVDVGRWRRDEQAGGYWIHDFLKYNPSAAKRLAEADAAEARKEADRERKAAARRAKEAVRNVSARNPSGTSAPRPQSVRSSPVPKDGTAQKAGSPVPPRPPDVRPDIGGAASPSSANASGDADSAAQPRNPPPRLSAQLKAEAAARTLAGHGIDNGNVPPPPATRPGADPAQFEAERARQLAALQVAADDPKAVPE